MNNLTTILVAVLGSNALLEIVRWLLGKNDSVKQLNERFDTLEKKLTKSEKDNVRMQLLFLLSDYPGRAEEIMEVAEHYFKDLEGNWFMTRIFKSWLEENKIDVPAWIR